MYLQIHLWKRFPRNTVSLKQKYEVCWMLYRIVSCILIVNACDGLWLPQCPLYHRDISNEWLPTIKWTIYKLHCVKHRIYIGAMGPAVMEISRCILKHSSKFGETPRPQWTPSQQRGGGPSWILSKIKRWSPQLQILLAHEHNWLEAG